MKKKLFFLIVINLTTSIIVYPQVLNLLDEKFSVDVKINQSMKEVKHLVGPQLITMFNKKTNLTDRKLNQFVDSCFSAYDANTANKALELLTYSLLDFPKNDGDYILKVLSSLKKISISDKEAFLYIINSEKYDKLIHSLNYEFYSLITAEVNKTINRNRYLKDNYVYINYLKELLLAQSETENEQTFKGHFAERGLSSIFQYESKSKLLSDYLAQFQGLDVVYDPSDKWNWGDHNWYVERHLDDPFEIGRSTGVDLSVDDCIPSDGWEIFIRRITTMDQSVTDKDTCLQLVDGTKYFSLYNKYTGTLRTFIYNDQTTFTPADYYIVEVYFTKGNSNFDKHGVFANMNSFSLTREDYGFLENNIVRFNCKYIASGWIVIDIPVSFDNLNYYYGHDLPYIINYNLRAVKSERITLEGDFHIQTQDQSNISPSFSGLFKTLFNGVSNISNISSSVNDFSDDLKSYGEKIVSQSSGIPQEFGNTLINAANLIIQGANPVSLIMGGIQLIQNLTSFNNSKISYTYYDGAINLKGETIAEPIINTAAFLYAYNTDVLSINVPTYFKNHPRGVLGIFEVSNPPPFQIVYRHSRGHYSDEEYGYAWTDYSIWCKMPFDFKELLKINTSVELSLEDVQIQPVFRKSRTDYQQDLTRSTTHYIINNLVFETHPDAEHWILLYPKDFLPSNYFFNWKPWVCHTRSITGGQQELQGLVDGVPYLRVYYYFKTPDNKKIEFIHSYKVYLQSFSLYDPYYSAEDHQPCFNTYYEGLDN